MLRSNYNLSKRIRVRGNDVVMSWEAPLCFPPRRLSLAAGFLFPIMELREAHWSYQGAYMLPWGGVLKTITGTVKYACNCFPYRVGGLPTRAA